jgi:hypothetical protein
MTKSTNDYEMHGMKHTATYRAWARMLSRCRNLEWEGSINHGQRGISYDPRWRHFTAFYADMGAMPEGTSLGRRNNEANYSKDNCRWETRTEQNNNRRLFKNNTSGIAGVTWAGLAVHVRVYHNKLRQKLYHGYDFFEACCVRKSWENSNGY